MTEGHVCENREPVHIRHRQEGHLDPDPGATGASHADGTSVFVRAHCSGSSRGFGRHRRSALGSGAPEKGAPWWFGGGI